MRCLSDCMRWGARKPGSGAGALPRCWPRRSAPARADVKLPAIFGDHMVLQRDQKDRVWGWADPGEEVTVTVTPHDQSKTATAGADGKWQVTLDPLATGGPYTVTVKGKNTITFNDVLVGEVWICSGQSNMQMGLGGSTDGDLAILSANIPRHPPDHRAQPGHAGAAEGLPRQVGSLLARERRRASPPWASSSAASSIRRWACRSA